MSVFNQLYIRVAILIAFAALLISALAAALSYSYNLEQQRALNGELVNQIALSTKNTAAIAAYIGDEELAQEIINGLVAVDLISGASLVIENKLVVQHGLINNLNDHVTIDLIDPFSSDLVVGKLSVYPDIGFIQRQAQSSGMQSAIVLILLSLMISIAVSLLVHSRLTSPIRRLTIGFAKVDPSNTDTMQPIDIGYRRKDEIGSLVGGINVLLVALKQNLHTERILRERTQKLEQRFRVIFEQASAGIGLVGKGNKLLTINPAMHMLFNELNVDDAFTDLFVDSKRVETTFRQMRDSTLQDQLSMDLEYMKGNERHWVHCLFAKVSDQRVQRRNDQDILIEVIMYDITDRIKREQSARFEADHDSLTRLRNRRSGEKALAKLLDYALKKHLSFILMMIDLDKFKPINDTHGHDVGDEVLVTISHRIIRYFDGENDVRIRWGGDEFIIGFILEEGNIRSIDQLCEQLIEEIRTPITISDNICCQVSGSIGVVQAPQNGVSLDALLSSADDTMYKVKHAGRDHYLIANSNTYESN